MEDKQHHIQKQILNFRFNGAKDPQQLQQELKTLYNAEILPVLQKECDVLNDRDAVFRIEKLELHIGDIHYRDMKKQLPVKIRKAFREAFEKLANPDTFRETPEVSTTISPVSGTQNALQKAEKITPEEVRREMLFYFLRTGSLPWQAIGLSVDELEKTFLELLETKDHTTINTLRNALQQPEISLRIAWQFSPRLITTLISVVIPQYSGAMLSILKEFYRLTVHSEALQLASFVKTVLSHTALTYTAPKLTLWQDKLYVEQLLQRISVTLRLPVTEIIRESVKTMLRHKSDYAVLPSLYIDMVEQFPFTAEEKKLLKNQLREITFAAQSTVLSRSPSEEKHSPGKDAVADAAKEDMPLSETEKETLPDTGDTSEDTIQTSGLEKIKNTSRKKDIPANRKAEGNTSTPGPGAVQPDTGKNTFQLDDPEKITRTTRREGVPAAQTTKEDLPAAVPGEKTLPEADEKDEASKQQFQKSPSLSGILEITEFREHKIPSRKENIFSPDHFSLPSEYYVHNAGVIILWPYLSEFFKKLQLVRERMFVDEEAVFRAVHILQFLTTGEENAAEFNLTLNKLLCNLPLATPVPLDVNLTTEEKAESEHLLKAVIRNWPILKSTSVNGLRQAFLKREGKLSPQQDQWLLNVEQKSYDMILEKIPWGIRTVKLPWMEKILYVEW